MASHVVGGSAMPVQCGLFCGVFGFLKYILTLVITAAVASQVVGGTASSVQCGLYALYSVQTRAAVASQVVGGSSASSVSVWRRPQTETQLLSH